MRGKGRSRRKGRPGKPRIRQVVHVTREFGSLAGAGGIKDVTDGLARASAAADIDTHVFLPHYRSIDAHDLRLEETGAFDIPMHYVGRFRTEPVAVKSVRLEERLCIHLVSGRRYRYLSEGSGTVERHGIYQYTREEAEAAGRPELAGKGYLDFFALNVLLVKAALRALEAGGVRPDVIHCHDGHAALLPLIAQASTEGVAPYLGHTPTVVTIHNAGRGYHQEIFDLDFAAAVCGVTREIVDGCLLGGTFDPLMAGGLFGSAINTVSENYARELQQTGQDVRTGWLGHALAGKGIRLHGVTNGLDPEPFDPRRGAAIGLAAPFSPAEGDLIGKAACKKYLLDAAAAGEAPEGIVLHGTLGPQVDTPLLTFVGRFDEQKGFDILADALERLLLEDGKFQVLGLGSGSPSLVDRFRRLAATFPGRVCVAVGFSGEMANRVYAAGDFFVVPSRFEPCGLTDFIAQLMGNVPVVHGVGGLVKTVDGRFGFSYLGGPGELQAALRRALTLYRESRGEGLREIQVAAAKNVYDNFTWDRVLRKKYIPLYKLAMARAAPALPY